MWSLNASASALRAHGWGGRGRSVATAFLTISPLPRLSSLPTSWHHHSYTLSYGGVNGTALCSARQSHLNTAECTSNVIKLPMTLPSSKPPSNFNVFSAGYINWYHLSPFFALSWALAMRWRGSSPDMVFSSDKCTTPVYPGHLFAGSRTHQRPLASSPYNIRPLVQERCHRNYYSSYLVLLSATIDHVIPSLSCPRLIPEEAIDCSHALLFALTCSGL